MAMVMGNAKAGGILIHHILEKGIGNQILRDYLVFLEKEKNLDEEEQLHLLGGYLRSYHHHFQ